MPMQDMSMIDGDNRSWYVAESDEDACAGRVLTYDEFMSEWVERPRWRQVIGNMLVRLAMRIGTTYSVE